MKVLLTGASGALGSEVHAYFPAALAPSHEELDIRDSSSLNRIFLKFKPDLVIHMAAIADVRLCEENRELAWSTNVEGTGNIVRACAESGSDPLLLYPSSPCVFKGDSGNYAESSKANPENYYGQTKQAAEAEVSRYKNSIIFRKNFVRRGRWKYPRAFTDRFGTYLFADEIAYIIALFPQSGIRGIVHIAGDKRLSMFELAKITTPDIMPMTMKDADLRLAQDMSLISERIEPFSMTRSAVRPKDYSHLKIRLRE